MTHTNPQDEHVAPAGGPPPEFFERKDWLYDTLMSHIEPDLMTENLPTLEEKYKDETPEQHKARMASYDRAFELFDKAFGEIRQRVDKDVHEHHLQVQKHREQEEKKERQTDISSAEQQLNSNL